MESKADRIRGIDGSSPATSPAPTSVENITRVHGDVAVTSAFRLAVGSQPQERWTIATVRQDGAWKLAAIIRTVVR